MRPMPVLATNARRASHAAARTSIAAIAVCLLLCPAALAAAPAPCGGVAQISDPSGDGHHQNTDVLSGWFSEQAGRLQAVIKVALGDWQPAHVASTTASWAFLFDAGGEQRYVRVVATKVPTTISYDYGTWTLAGGFVSAGATTGEVTTGQGATATIDVPAATGATAGTVLARPFVLTYESDPSEPGPVDRAPGGVTAGEAAFGADYVVGSCQPPPTAGSGAGDSPSPAASGAVTTTAVVFSAPKRIVGARRVRAGGRVVPARAGVAVQVTTKARGSAKAPIVRTATTLADGSFSVSVPVSETSTMTAVAEQINAQTLTVVVHSTVRLTLRRVAGGRIVASGRVMPRLPGRVLLLRSNAAVPSASTAARRGLFRFAARRLARGRYQAVFIPSRHRAERSTSRSGAVRRVALGADGYAALTLKPAIAAATRLRRVRGPLDLTGDAATGDRHNVGSATLDG